MEETQGPTYSKILDKPHASVVHKRVVPVPVPVLEEDTIELVVQPRVRGAEDDRHLHGGLGVDVEAVQGAGRDDELAVLGRLLVVLALVVDDAHDAGLDVGVLGLVAVDVQGGTLGLAARLDEPVQGRGDGGPCLDLVLVGLAELE